MAKKRVPISLRKPPSPERVEAFVRGDEGPGAGGRDPAQASGLRPIAGPAVDVGAAPSAPPSPSPGDREPAGEVFVGPDGAALRPVTIYLPAAFAEELAVYCAGSGRDAGRVIREALEAHFLRQLGPFSGEVAGEGNAADASPPGAGGEWRRREAGERRDFSGQRAALALLDGALRVFEVGQALAMRLRVQVQRA